MTAGRDPRDLKDLKAAIAARAMYAVDARESASIKTALAELARLRHPFDESADPVHLTASGIVIGERGTVLHLHKRTGMWLQPGGHIDTGELPHEASLREALEETGLTVAHPPAGPSFVHVDVHPGPKGHTHLDLRYLLHAPDDDPCPGEDESPFVRWFGWEEAIAVADAGLRGALVSLRPV